MKMSEYYLPEFLSANELTLLICFIIINLNINMQSVRREIAIKGGDLKSFKRRMNKYE